MAGEARWDGDDDPWAGPEFALDEPLVPPGAEDEPLCEAVPLPDGCAETVYVCGTQTPADPGGPPRAPRHVSFVFHRTETDWLYVWCGMDLDEEIGPGEARQTLVWGDTVVTMVGEHPLAAGEFLHLAPGRLGPGPLAGAPSRIVITLPGGTTVCTPVEAGRGWPL